MKLTSDAFSDGETIPAIYTCEGKDINPPLEINNVSNGAKSLVLIMDDPDAPDGTWVHWVVFNIPPATKNIEEGKESDGTRGKNSWGKVGYRGPCPPSGTHHYNFKLYALDSELNLQESVDKEEIEAAMAGHILDEAGLTGLYKKL